MKTQEAIVVYERIAEVMSDMLSAARNGEWDHLTVLESRCASHVDVLRSDPCDERLQEKDRQRKVALIHAIIEKDRLIRDLVDPWMAQLARQINSIGAERRLDNAY